MADWLSLASSDNAWVVLQTKQGVMQSPRRGNSITNDEEWIHKPGQKRGEADSKKLVASKKKTFHPLIFLRHRREEKKLTARQSSLVLWIIVSPIRMLLHPSLILPPQLTHERFSFIFEDTSSPFWIKTKFLLCAWQAFYRRRG